MEQLDVTQPAASTNTFLRTIQTPPLGQPWPGQGGIYAGIARGADGEPDYHLIVANEAGELGAAPWDVAMAWAAGFEIDGHSDFTLPRRTEQAIAYGNVPELFEKDWYWSCTQRAADSDYAWGQGFGYGGQFNWGKFFTCRARAVRRLSI